MKLNYKLPLGVTPMKLSVAKVKFIWNKFNEFPILDDLAKGDFELFLRRIMAVESAWFEMHNQPPLTEQVGEFAGFVGVMWAENIVIYNYADVHIFFWDSRLKGREVICKEMIRWLFDHLQVFRLATAAPIYAKAVIRFIKRLGFVEEGIQRKAYLHDGELFDQVMFGLLKDEFINVEVENGGDQDGRRNEIEIDVRSEQRTKEDAASIIQLPSTENG